MPIRFAKAAVCSLYMVGCRFPGRLAAAYLLWFRAPSGRWGPGRGLLVSIKMPPELIFMRVLPGAHAGVGRMSEPGAIVPLAEVRCRDNDSCGDLSRARKRCLRDGDVRPLMPLMPDSWAAGLGDWAVNSGDWPGGLILFRFLCPIFETSKQCAGLAQPTV